MHPLYTFSCLAFSTLASWCRKFMSRIFSRPSSTRVYLSDGVSTAARPFPWDSFLSPRSQVSKSYTSTKLPLGRGSAPIDRLSCGFTSHWTHFGDVSPSQSLGFVWKKLNPTQQKHAFANQKKCTTTQNKHKQLKPGLVAFYDIRPGNGAGLFSMEKISKGGD